ncbi:MAG: (2Fe-2S) ferredoxin domain-containing protein [Myxococcota bacterium]|nr:(2Fe-2S) ferredoxin domain-containing protein [Myxococcota bacterium]
MARPRVYVCKGSSCRKDSKGYRKLVDALEPASRVTLVKCQKICDGPVAGVVVDDTLRWYSELHSAKRRQALLVFLQTVELLGRLRKRGVSKRKGKLRR